MTEEQAAKSPEERLKDTIAQVVSFIYLRTAAKLQGRDVRSFSPPEVETINALFEDDLKRDVEFLSEVGLQFKILGIQIPQETFVPEDVPDVRFDSKEGD